MNTKYVNLAKNQDIFSISYVLDNFVDENEGKKKVSVDVYSPQLNKTLKVYKNSDRYILFKKQGCTCVSCGLTASHFVLLQDTSNPTNGHFQLIAINDKNEHVIFAKDHIVPRSLGGKNHIDNYQVMCYDCNNKKQNDCSVEIYNEGLRNNTIMTIQPVRFSIPAVFITNKSIEILYNWIELHGWTITRDPNSPRGFIVNANHRGASNYITKNLPLIKDLMNATKQKLIDIENVQPIIMKPQPTQKMTFIEKLKFLFAK